MVGWFADGPPDEADARRFVAANVAHSLPPDSEAKAVADVCRTDPAAWIDWLKRGTRDELERPDWIPLHVRADRRRGR
ncbi:hypothetical protein AB5I41_10290 [Sphingomonas sp. MMS24-JH45]